MNLTGKEVREILGRAGLPSSLWQMADESYETVSDGWVEENWAAWLEARPIELCVMRDSGGKRIRERPRWIAEASDCDNLALGTLTHGHVGNALAAVHRDEARGGLAYFAMFYVATTHVQGRHVINAKIGHDGQVKFFEPGLGEWVDPEAAERSSAWFGLAA